MNWQKVNTLPPLRPKELTQGRQNFLQRKMTNFVPTKKGCRAFTARGPFKKTAPNLTTFDKCEWVRRNRQSFKTLKEACKMIKISPSTYHRDLKVSREEKAEQDANIRHQIELIRRS
jgi:hypothetical protein